MKTNQVDQWNGAHYHQNSSLQYNVATTLLARHRFKGDEQVLDVGCGDGQVSCFVAAKVPRGQVLAVDYSQSMIDEAQKHPKPSNLTFKQQDAQQLDFDQQFDLVISTCCLQWVPNKQMAFRGIYQSLKPGGQAILIMPIRNPIVEKITTQLTTDPRWQTRFGEDYRNPAEEIGQNNDYQSHAQRAGFTITDYQAEPITNTFKNRSELAGFLKGISLCLNKLADDPSRTQFLEEMVTRYLQVVPPNPDGSCAITYTFIKLFAQRPAH